MSTRRKFITLLGGVAAWPLAARAQQPERVRRVGMLMALPNDRVGQTYLAAFQEGLKKLGWTHDRSVRLDTRWAADADRLQAFAIELVGLRPDVIVAGATSALAALSQATRTIPIVFAQVSDPVGAGFVASLARPGGNATGFALYEYAIGVKWLELLKQIAPGVARVAAIYEPVNPASSHYLATVEAAAPSFSVLVTGFAVHDATEIKHAIGRFGGATYANSYDNWSRHRKISVSGARLVHRRIIGRASCRRLVTGCA